MKARRRTGSRSSLECLASIPDLAEYLDKWIAIVDNEVVSVGDTGKQVFKEAKGRHPGSVPLVLKVPSNYLMLL